MNEKTTLEDLFDFVRPEEGVRVVPITMKREAGDSIADMMIVITGGHDTASVIMAQLMSLIDELQAHAQQTDQVKEDRGLQLVS